MEQTRDQFHDPELKAALRRAVGDHKASPQLRSRIDRMFAEARAADGNRDGGAAPAASTAATVALTGSFTEHKADRSQVQRRGWFIGRPWLAAAASLVILIGGSFRFVHYRHEQHELEEQREYAEANMPLLKAMIATHEGDYSKDPSRQTIAAPLNNPQAVAQDLGKLVGREVPTVNFQGWTVDSAGVCKVGDVRAAHWHLRNNNGKQISVLSIPATAIKSEEGYSDYEFTVDGHAIAGFLRKDGVNCVVCDPSFSQQDAVDLREQLKRT